MISDTDSIARDYRQDGVVRISNFLPPDLMKDVRAQLDRYVTQVAPTLPPGDRTFEADGKTVRNLWRMEQHDPFFRDLAARSEILDLVRILVNGEPVLMGVETFNKPARVGSGVPPHQDNAYFCQTPPDALTIWIALDAATLDNGPIYYLKASHTAGVFEHRPSGIAGNSMGLVAMPPHEKSEEFCGTLSPGDALIHHCQTVHWSSPNKTDHPRCGLLIVSRGAHTSHDAQLKSRYDAARASA